MLRVFRIKTWCLVTALCLAMGTATASLDLLLHADATHADACLPATLVPHDASAHRIQAAPAHDAGTATHCVFCHWARSFRPRTEVGPAAPHVDERRALGASSTAGPALTPVLAHLAPRSPPRLV